MDLKKTARHIAALWVQAKGQQWQDFLDEVYEGGRKQVRNTNRDTQDRFPTVEVLTLLKTDRKLHKLMRGQFSRWMTQREKEGPRGEPVQDVGDLKPGQQLEWSSRKETLRGVVERVRPDRAIIKLPNGKVQHLQPFQLERLQPRVIG